MKQAWFMIFLVLSIPLTSTLALAQLSSSPTPYQIGDVGQQCIQKNQKTHSLVSFLENDVISVIEQIISILYAITTIANAIDTVIDTIYTVTECCFPNPFTAASCVGQEAEIIGWETGIFSTIRSLSCIVNCGWCGGADGQEGTGDDGCFGIGSLMSGISLGAMPSVIGPTGGPGGLAQFHLSPYENIYTAVGCLCPTAILFNLRKLKTIYDTYNCCVSEACTNGFSTQGCERMLSEATCMYWEGSVYLSLAKVLISVIASLLADLIVDLVGSIPGLACAMSIFDLVQLPSVVMGVINAFDWVSTTFTEPTCEDLGFENIREGYEQGLWTQNAGQTILTLRDVNGDGIYDNMLHSFSSQDLSDTEAAALHLPGYADDWDVTRITGYNSNFELVTVYEVDPGILEDNLYFNANKQTITEEQFTTSRSSMQTVSFYNGYVTVGEGEPRPYTIDGTNLRIGSGETAITIPITPDFFETVYGLEDVTQSGSNLYYQGRQLEYQGGLWIQSPAASLTIDGQTFTYESNGVWREQGTDNYFKYENGQLKKSDSPTGTFTATIQSSDIVNAIRNGQSNVYITQNYQFVQASGGGNMYQILDSDGDELFNQPIEITGNVPQQIPKISEIISAVDEDVFDDGNEYSLQDDGLYFVNSERRIVIVNSYNIGGENIGIVLENNIPSAYVAGNEVNLPDSEITDPRILAQTAFVIQKYGTGFTRNADGSYSRGDEGTENYLKIEITSTGEYRGYVNVYNNQGSVSFNQNGVIIERVIGTNADASQNIIIDYDQLNTLMYGGPAESTTVLLGDNFYFFKDGTWYGSDGNELSLAQFNNLPEDVRNKLNQAKTQITEDLEKNKEKTQAEQVKKQVDLDKERRYEEILVHRATWELLYNTLGPFAYDYVSDYCKDQYDSSEAENT